MYTILIEPRSAFGAVFLTMALQMEVDSIITLNYDVIARFGGYFVKAVSENDKSERYWYNLRRMLKVFNISSQKSK